MRLRTRLLVYGLVILLVTTAGAVVTILLSRQALEARAFAQLRSVRDTKASQIEEEIAQFLGNLEVLAGSAPARTALTDLPPAFTGSSQLRVPARASRPLCSWPPSRHDSLRRHPG